MENIGNNPIIEEFIAEEHQENVPYEEIKKNVENSDLVLLLLTDNITSTQHTSNWVNFEIGVASEAHKRLFVFESSTMKSLFPIPYITDYALFDPENIADMFDMQKLIKKISNNTGLKNLTGIGGGAALGSIFGPAGMVIGAIAGLLISSTNGNNSDICTKVTCPNEKCNITFLYYSSQLQFTCPTCRKNISLGKL